MFGHKIGHFSATEVSPLQRPSEFSNTDRSYDLPRPSRTALPSSWKFFVTFAVVSQTPLVPATWSWTNLCDAWRWGGGSSRHNGCDKHEISCILHTCALNNSRMHKSNGYPTYLFQDPTRDNDPMAYLPVKYMHLATCLYMSFTLK